MKLLMGVFLLVSLAFLSAANIQAQPAPAQQKKLNELSNQIDQLRGQIKQETAKLNTMKDKMIALQDQLRNTMESIMGGSMELGSEIPIDGPKEEGHVLGAAGSQNLGPVHQ